MSPNQRSSKESSKQVTKVRRSALSVVRKTGQLGKMGHVPVVIAYGCNGKWYGLHHVPAGEMVPDIFKPIIKELDANPDAQKVPLRRSRRCHVHRRQNAAAHTPTVAASASSASPENINHLDAELSSHHENESPQPTTGSATGQQLEHASDPTARNDAQSPLGTAPSVSVPAHLGRVQGVPADFILQLLHELADLANKARARMETCQAHACQRRR